jgi:cytoskeletal protein CcmA (bactofilin family)
MPPSEPARAQMPQSREEKPPMEALVNIGQSVEIKGTLTGNEDLTIEGIVDGKILVKDHSLTIGANGRINAEVHAKKIVVLGHVTGNITADDKVEIAPSGSVHGDVKAPRVSIADGATFKGSIDMEKKAGTAAQVAAVHAAPLQVATMGGGAVPGGMNRPAVPSNQSPEQRVAGASIPKG